MSFQNLLDSTVDIFREVQTADSQGGQTHTDTYTHRRVKCRFESAMGRAESAIYGKVTVYPDYYVYMEYISDLKEGDRLIDKRARQYEVKFINNWSERDKYMKLAVVNVGRNEA